MMAAFASRQLEYWESSNMLHAYGSPLPRQGEEEGEGLSEATRVDSETPHLSPLPFRKGRGEKGRCSSSSFSTFTVNERSRS